CAHSAQARPPRPRPGRRSRLRVGARRAGPKLTDSSARAPSFVLLSRCAVRRRPGEENEVSAAAGARPELPELSLEGWEPTKNTLHLWVQIVGKVRMVSTAPSNHWWHVPLYVDVPGLTTARM